MSTAFYRKPALGIALLIIIYAVGIAGVLIPLHGDFMKLTPYNLLFSMLVMFAWARRDSIRFYYLAAAVFVAGMAVEILGVHTGLPFGHYHYGHILGPELMGVPLIIGLNWFFLVYATTTALRTHTTITHKLAIAAVAALMMLLYDFLLEPVAVFYEFWTWHAGHIPWTNYLAWYAISLPMCYLAALWLPHEKNYVALPLLCLQCVFFTLIIIWVI